MRLGLGLFCAGCLVASSFSGCGDDFSDCSATRTCAQTTEDAGAAGVLNSLDANDGGRPTIGDGGAPSAEAPQGTAGALLAIGGGGASTDAGCAEVDTRSDARNCGRCGHECLGGECLSGECQPVALGENLGRFIHISADSTYIYWSGDSATIGKVKKDGTGTAEVLIPKAAGELGYDNAVVDQTLYWSNDFQDNGVRGCALPACSAPKTVLPGTAPTDAIQFSEAVNSLFWNQSNVIWSVALPAGNPKTFYKTEKRVYALAADSTFLYWTEWDDVAKKAIVRKRPLTGGAVMNLATNLVSTYNLVVSNDLLFTIDGPEQGLHTIPLPAGLGDKDTEAFAVSRRVRTMVVDDTDVYWGEDDGSDTGKIRWCPRSGCTGMPLILAETGSPASMLLDSTAIYWGTDDGRIFKLAR